MLTDTHCHLADPAFSKRLPSILSAAAQAGVCRFIVPATRRSNFDTVLALSSYPNVHTAIGIHPWFADSATAADLAYLQQLLSQHPHALTGEIGLDFYNKQQTEAQYTRQTELLNAQLKLAEQYRRPAIFHNLKATTALVAAIRHAHFTQGGIAHAFSGSLEEAQNLISCGLLIGIGSLLLNSSAKKVRQAAAELPLEHLVLETDSPFMLPNQTNTPANVRTITEITAQLRGTTWENIAAQTEENVTKLLAFQTAPKPTP